MVNYEDRLKQVQERVLNNEDLLKYISENNKIKNTTQILSYERSKKILENCASFLLRGQYKENNILTIYNIRQASVIELPVSNVNGNASDLMHSVNKSLEENEQTINASTSVINFGTPRKGRKTYKDTKFYKLNKLNKKFANKNCIINWCLVNTDNLFYFNGLCFIISKSNKNYEVSKNNQSEMEKILCYYLADENKYLFFDENIKDITDDVKKQE